jgi:Zn-dependent protease
MEVIIFLISIACFGFTIIIHEVAHGVVADRLGDPTARVNGRLTLNPLPHIDLYGSVIIPLFLIFAHSPFLFGWAKPVPVDPYNLKDPKKDTALISLAGPLANIIVATLLALLYKFFVVDQIVAGLILQIVAFNVSLALFNLIPISPLDGEKVLAGILPKREAYQLDRFMEQYGLILFIFIIFPIFNGISLVSYFLYPAISFVINLLVPGFGTI